MASDTLRNTRSSVYACTRRCAAFSRQIGDRVLASCLVVVDDSATLPSPYTSPLIAVGVRLSLAGKRRFFFLEGLAIEDTMAPAVPASHSDGTRRLHSRLRDKLTPSTNCGHGDWAPAPPQTGHEPITESQHTRLWRIFEKTDRTRRLQVWLTAVRDRLDEGHPAAGLCDDLRTSYPPRSLTLEGRDSVQVGRLV